ncbi:DUF4136 domain-containing protein [Chryseolinea sp. T2]|uniref:DUF4136 domain-containing protein n=1 Tax=Chryseolinea sp. T2 TaxID=3129255 RepID=UPI00307797F3
MRQFLTASLVLLLAGCYPQGPDYAEDTDVVYTTYDERYDFKSRETYSMPDKIVTDIKIDDGDTTYEFMADKFAAPIFDKIEENMTALGYDRVDLDASPDLYLTPAAIKSTNYFYSYWYDWWYPYWDWGWYYPPYYSVSSYTTGSLIMTLSDPSQAEDSPINRSQTVWVSAANGLASYSYDISRVTKSIDQSFRQSPYLTTK